MIIQIKEDGFGFSLYLNKKITKKICLFFSKIVYMLLGAFGDKILHFILEMLKKC